jgi:hypothetical protein
MISTDDMHDHPCDRLRRYQQAGKWQSSHEISCLIYAPRGVLEHEPSFP